METFPKPPITEALIDIRAELGPEITLSNLERLHEKIKPQYPTKHIRRRWEGVLEMKEDVAVMAESKDLGADGYFFWSADKKQAVQYRLDGFTFNKLRPYHSWQAMCDEAKPLWELYVEAVVPVTIRRLALRYINSIEIPGELIYLEEYFTAPPRVPVGLSSIIEGFLSRVEISFPEFGSRAIITQTVQPPRNPNVTSILFDSDVYREVTLKGDSQELWQIFEGLRGIKNEIFDKSISEKTRELFRCP